MSSPAGQGAGRQGFSQVGHGARVKGKIEGPGVLVVHGRVGGDVVLEGELIVADDGALESVRAKLGALRVEGRAEGEFRVAGPVELARGGQLEGAVRSRVFQVAPGARIEAQLQVDAGFAGGGDVEDEGR